MSVNVENLANASEQYDPEESNSNNEIHPKLLGQRFREILETLNEQISKLIELFKPFIHDNLAKTTPTASSIAQSPNLGPSLDNETGATRISPDNRWYTIPENVGIELISTHSEWRVWFNFSILLLNFDVDKKTLRFHHTIWKQYKFQLSYLISSQKCSLEFW